MYVCVLYSHHSDSLRTGHSYRSKSAFTESDLEGRANVGPNDMLHVLGDPHQAQQPPDPSAHHHHKGGAKKQHSGGGGRYKGGRKR